MIDKARITIRAGNGGSGDVSFRREKYVPLGGPDGGDGGDGGRVLIRAQSGQHMLRAFRYKRNFHADDGGRGRGGNKTGRAGKDFVIDVPLGTLVTKIGLDGERTVLGDLVVEGDKLVAAEGGYGGKGNARFTRPQNRAPILAEAGGLSEDITLDLELQILADIAIIGMPSVGKSSLLRVCSRARPDVAAYPFTTLEPVLGVVERNRREFVLAEIPGLIEGAHLGAGLGFEFLRHMQRVSGVIHVLDGSSETVVQDYLQVREEMKLYDERLLDKPEIVVVNKIDMPEVQERRAELEAALAAIKIKALFIAAVTEEGVGALLDKALEMQSLQPITKASQPKVIPILKPMTNMDGRVSIEKDQEVFVVKSARAERIVRRVDLEDWAIQTQLWGELTQMGIVRALERAGAKAGSTVKIGDWELEWK
ncbi:MAG: GTPase ObgE [Chloroflexi bacterium]|nr:GTPase ObgE [Chloroflexota bacterium]